MKVDKDVVLAITIGVAIGGLTAFFVFFLPKIAPKTSPKTEQEETVKKEELTPPLTPSALLTIESPQDGAIFSEDKISVSGKTKPGALVAIVSLIDEQVVEANDNGVFEAEISLEEGTNEISVTAYLEEDEEETLTVIVYYTEEEI